MYTVTTQQIIHEPTIDFTICSRVNLNAAGLDEYTDTLLKELNSIQFKIPSIKWNLGVAIRLSAAKPMRFVAPLSEIQSLVTQINSKPEDFTNLKELFSDVLHENLQ